MVLQRTLVLIKPDAMVKKLAGNIINEFYRLDLRVVGLKLVNVGRELAEQHYSGHKGKPFFERLVKHITGELHNSENVIAIVYEGNNAVKKVRDLVGNTSPEEASWESIRGRFGRLNSKNDCYENVVHASDSEDSAKKEIELWFDEGELVN
jgi:nucleoside-diphosphate kinase